LNNIQARHHGAEVATMQDTMDESIAVTRQDGVGWITLNRPSSINAINDAMRSEVPRALRSMDEDPAVRVIVFHGAGERGFCAGADLKESRPATTVFAARSSHSNSNWIRAFDTVAKPTIAAIHGYCFGGGLEIALACDLRIAAADAVFSLPETGLGLIPGGGGTQRLPRIVGLSRALDLLLTGDRIDGSEAHRIGLVTRLTPTAETLLDEAGALARRIAQRPPLATRLCKEAARSGVELELGAGLRLEKDLFTMLLGTDERREAVAAFREKRAPVFNDN
jgi:enoyl-CoA hydratase/carnithine racemase